MDDTDFSDLLAGTDQSEVSLLQAKILEFEIKEKQTALLVLKLQQVTKAKDFQNVQLQAKVDDLEKEKAETAGESDAVQGLQSELEAAKKGAKEQEILLEERSS